MLLEEFVLLEKDFEKLKFHYHRQKNFYKEILISVEKRVNNLVYIHNTQKIITELENSISERIIELKVFFFDLSKAYPQMNLEDVVKMIRNKKQICKKDGSL